VARRFAVIMLVEIVGKIIVDSCLFDCVVIVVAWMSLEIKL